MAFKIGKALKSLVGTVAPMLGTAVGGPFGGIAGKFIQDALGVDNEQQAMQALQSDPEALAKVKVAGIEFEKRMAELGIEEEQLHAEDRASARQLGREKGTGFQMILSAVFMAGYFVLIYLFFAGDFTVEDEWSRGQLGILIGILTAAIPQILAYWFGSSSGSKQKSDAMIGKL